MDEQDVKIYRGVNECDSDLQNELVDALEIINKQRSNGNIEKACCLGKRLATISVADSEGCLSLHLDEHLRQRFFAPTILYQIRVLLIFTVEASLQINLPSDLLITTATNAVHDYLRKNASDFYRNISDGAAFSFYYLTIKKGVKIEDGIGNAFAMLCGAEDNQAFVEAGKTVFGLAIKAINEEIKNVEFEAE